MAEGKKANITRDKSAPKRQYVKYSRELAEQICEEISCGLSLRAVCRMDGMPEAKSVFRWMRENPDFEAMYGKACQERSEAMLEDIIEIADDNSQDWVEDNYQKGPTPGYRVNAEVVQRSKLRIEARQWHMSKMKPKKYGDKLDLTTGGDKLPTPIYGGASGGTPAINAPD